MLWIGKLWIIWHLSRTSIILCVTDSELMMGNLGKLDKSVSVCCDQYFKFMKSNKILFNILILLLIYSSLKLTYSQDALIARRSLFFSQFI